MATVAKKVHRRSPRRAPAAIHEGHSRYLELAEERFKSYLQKRGLKYTPERVTILHTVMENHGHFEVEDLILAMRKKGQRVSKATTYRTLSLLLGAAIIRQLVFGPKHAYYEHIYGHRHHEHMVCLQCGKISEFLDPRLAALVDEIVDQHGFTLTSHRFTLFGLCSDCRKLAPAMSELSAAVEPTRVATEYAGEIHAEDEGF
jgi:Fur family ferric uptake transcriptional regulator